MKIHALPALVLLGLSACTQVSETTSGERDLLPVLPPPADDTCNANARVMLVGQPASALERVEIVAPVRVIRPNTAVTMDFREDRINFYVDDNGLITNILCG
ncbi:MAG: hypothetical protein JJT81_06695 [Rubellimicrobium sp.]|nr:hypothetical protein [Rubellimicrobium sp.]